MADFDKIFLSTLSLRRATTGLSSMCTRRRFLSTLSLRRATVRGSQACAPDGDFYPRSPCGERLIDLVDSPVAKEISIHALLAESDLHEALHGGRLLTFLSTLSLRRATCMRRCTVAGS